MGGFEVALAKIKSKEQRFREAAGRFIASIVRSPSASDLGPQIWEEFQLPESYRSVLPPTRLRQLNPHHRDIAQHGYHDLKFLDPNMTSADDVPYFQLLNMVIRDIAFFHLLRGEFIESWQEFAKHTSRVEQDKQALSNEAAPEWVAEQQRDNVPILKLAIHEGVGIQYVEPASLAQGTALLRQYRDDVLEETAAKSRYDAHRRLLEYGVKLCSIESWGNWIENAREFQGKAENRFTGQLSSEELEQLRDEVTGFKATPLIFLRSDELIEIAYDFLPKLEEMWLVHARKQFVALVKAKGVKPTGDRELDAKFRKMRSWLQRKTSSPTIAAEFAKVVEVNVLQQIEKMIADIKHDLAMEMMRRIKLGGGDPYYDDALLDTLEKVRGSGAFESSLELLARLKSRDKAGTAKRIQQEARDKTFVDLIFQDRKKHNISHSRMTQDNMLIFIRFIFTGNHGVPIDEDIVRQFSTNYRGEQFVRFRVSGGLVLPERILRIKNAKGLVIDRPEDTAGSSSAVAAAAGDAIREERVLSSTQEIDFKELFKPNPLASIFNLQRSVREGKHNQIWEQFVLLSYAEAQIISQLDHYSEMCRIAQDVMQDGEPRKDIPPLPTHFEDYPAMRWLLLMESVLDEVINITGYDRTTKAIPRNMFINIIGSKLASIVAGSENAEYWVLLANYITGLRQILATYKRRVGRDIILRLNRSLSAYTDNILEQKEHGQAAEDTAVSLARTELGAYEQFVGSCETFSADTADVTANVYSTAFVAQKDFVAQFLHALHDSRVDGDGYHSGGFYQNNGDLNIEKVHHLAELVGIYNSPEEYRAIDSLRCIIVNGDLPEIDISRIYDAESSDKSAAERAQDKLQAKRACAQPLVQTLIILFSMYHINVRATEGNKGLTIEADVQDEVAQLATQYRQRARSFLLGRKDTKSAQEDAARNLLKLVVDLFVCRQYEDERSERAFKLINAFASDEKCVAMRIRWYEDASDSREGLFRVLHEALRASVFAPVEVDSQHAVTEQHAQIRHGIGSLLADLSYPAADEYRYKKGESRPPGVQVGAVKYGQNTDDHVLLLNDVAMVAANKTHALSVGRLFLLQWRVALLRFVAGNDHTYDTFYRDFGITGDKPNAVQQDFGEGLKFSAYQANRYGNVLGDPRLQAFERLLLACRAAPEEAMTAYAVRLLRYCVDAQANPKIEQSLIGRFIELSFVWNRADDALSGDRRAILFRTRKFSRSQIQELLDIAKDPALIKDPVVLNFLIWLVKTSHDPNAFEVLREARYQLLNYFFSEEATLPLVDVDGTTREQSLTTIFGRWEQEQRSEPMARCLHTSIQLQSDTTGRKAICPQFTLLLAVWDELNDILGATIPYNNIEQYCEIGRRIFKEAFSEAAQWDPEKHELNDEGLPLTAQKTLSLEVAALPTAMQGLSDYHLPRLITKYLIPPADRRGMTFDPVHSVHFVVLRHFVASDDMNILQVGDSDEATIYRNRLLQGRTPQVLTAGGRPVDISNIMEMQFVALNSQQQLLTGRSVPDLETKYGDPQTIIEYRLTLLAQSTVTDYSAAEILNLTDLIRSEIGTDIARYENVGKLEFLCSDAAYIPLLVKVTLLYLLIRFVAEKGIDLDSHLAVRYQHLPVLMSKLKTQIMRGFGSELSYFPNMANIPARKIEHYCQLLLGADYVAMLEMQEFLLEDPAAMEVQGKVLQQFQRKVVGLLSEMYYTLSTYVTTEVANVESYDYDEARPTDTILPRKHFFNVVFDYFPEELQRKACVSLVEYLLKPDLNRKQVSIRSADKIRRENQCFRNGSDSRSMFLFIQLLTDRRSPYRMIFTQGEFQSMLSAVRRADVSDFIVYQLMVLLADIAHHENMVIRSIDDPKTKPKKKGQLTLRDFPLDFVSNDTALLRQYLFERIKWLIYTLSSYFADKRLSLEPQEKRALQLYAEKGGFVFEWVTDTNSALRRAVTDACMRGSKPDLELEQKVVARITETDNTPLMRKTIIEQLEQIYTGGLTSVQRVLELILALQKADTRHGILQEITSTDTGRAVTASNRFDKLWDKLQRSDEPILPNILSEQLQDPARSEVKDSRTRDIVLERVQSNIRDLFQSNDPRHVRLAIKLTRNIWGFIRTAPRIRKFYEDLAAGAARPYSDDDLRIIHHPFVLATRLLDEDNEMQTRYEIRWQHENVMVDGVTVSRRKEQVGQYFIAHPGENKWLRELTRFIASQLTKLYTLMVMSGDTALIDDFLTLVATNLATVNVGHSDIEYAAVTSGSDVTLETAQRVFAEYEEAKRADAAAREPFIRTTTGETSAGKTLGIAFDDMLRIFRNGLPQGFNFERFCATARYLLVRLDETTLRSPGDTSSSNFLDAFSLIHERLAAIFSFEYLRSIEQELAALDYDDIYRETWETTDGLSADALERRARSEFEEKQKELNLKYKAAKTNSESAVFGEGALLFYAMANILIAADERAQYTEQLQSLVKLAIENVRKFLHQGGEHYRQAFVLIFALTQKRLPEPIQENQVIRLQAIRVTLSDSGLDPIQTIGTMVIAAARAIEKKLNKDFTEENRREYFDFLKLARLCYFGAKTIDDGVVWAQLKELSTSLLSTTVGKPGYAQFLLEIRKNFKAADQQEELQEVMTFVRNLDSKEMPSVALGDEGADGADAAVSEISLLQRMTLSADVDIEPLLKELVRFYLLLSGCKTKLEIELADRDISAARRAEANSRLSEVSKFCDLCQDHIFTLITVLANKIEDKKAKELFVTEKINGIATQLFSVKAEDLNLNPRFATPILLENALLFFARAAHLGMQQPHAVADDVEAHKSMHLTRMQDLKEHLLSPAVSFYQKHILSIRDHGLAGIERRQATLEHDKVRLTQTAGKLEELEGMLSRAEFLQCYELVAGYTRALPLLTNRLDEDFNVPLRQISIDDLRLIVFLKLVRKVAAIKGTSLSKEATQYVTSWPTVLTMSPQERASLVSVFFTSVMQELNISDDYELRDSHPELHALIARMITTMTKDEAEFLPILGEELGEGVESSIAVFNQSIDTVLVAYANMLLEELSEEMRQACLYINIPLALSIIKDFITRCWQDVQGSKEEDIQLLITQLDLQQVICFSQRPEDEDAEFLAQKVRAIVTTIVTAEPAMLQADMREKAAAMKLQAESLQTDVAALKPEIESIKYILRQGEQVMRDNLVAEMFSSKDLHVILEELKQKYFGKLDLLTDFFIRQGESLDKESVRHHYWSTLIKSVFSDGNDVAAFASLYAETFGKLEPAGGFLTAIAHQKEGLFTAVEKYFTLDASVVRAAILQKFELIIAEENIGIIITMLKMMIANMFFEQLRHSAKSNPADQSVAQRVTFFMTNYGLMSNANLCQIASKYTEVDASSALTFSAFIEAVIASIMQGWQPSIVLMVADFNRNQEALKQGVVAYQGRIAIEEHRYDCDVARVQAYVGFNGEIILFSLVKYLTKDNLMILPAIAIYNILRQVVVATVTDARNKSIYSRDDRLTIVLSHIFSHLADTILPHCIGKEGRTGTYSLLKEIMSYFYLYCGNINVGMPTSRGLIQTLSRQLSLFLKRDLLQADDVNERPRIDETVRLIKAVCEKPQAYDSTNRAHSTAFQNIVRAGAWQGLANVIIEYLRTKFDAFNISYQHNPTMDKGDLVNLLSFLRAIYESVPAEFLHLIQETTQYIVDEMTNFDADLNMADLDYSNDFGALAGWICQYADPQLARYTRNRAISYVDSLLGSRSNTALRCRAVLFIEKISPARTEYKRQERSYGRWQAGMLLSRVHNVADEEYRSLRAAFEGVVLRNLALFVNDTTVVSNLTTMAKKTFSHETVEKIFRNTAALTQKVSRNVSVAITALLLVLEDVSAREALISSIGDFNLESGISPFSHAVYSGKYNVDLDPIIKALSAPQIKSLLQFIENKIHGDNSVELTFARKIYAYYEPILTLTREYWWDTDDFTAIKSQRCLADLDRYFGRKLEVNISRHRDVQIYEEDTARSIEFASEVLLNGSERQQAYLRESILKGNGKFRINFMVFHGGESLRLFAHMANVLAYYYNKPSEFQILSGRSHGQLPYKKSVEVGGIVYKDLSTLMQNVAKAKGLGDSQYYQSLRQHFINILRLLEAAMLEPEDNATLNRSHRKSIITYYFLLITAIKTELYKDQDPQKGTSFANDYPLLNAELVLVEVRTLAAPAAATSSASTDGAREKRREKELAASSVDTRSAWEAILQRGAAVQKHEYQQLTGKAIEEKQAAKSGLLIGLGGIGRRAQRVKEGAAAVRNAWRGGAASADELLRPPKVDEPAQHWLNPYPWQSADKFWGELYLALRGICDVKKVHKNLLQLLKAQLALLQKRSTSLNPKSRDSLLRIYRNVFNVLGPPAAGIVAADHKQRYHEASKEWREIFVSLDSTLSSICTKKLESLIGSRDKLVEQRILISELFKSCEFLSFILGLAEIDSRDQVQNLRKSVSTLIDALLRVLAVWLSSESIPFHEEMEASDVILPVKLHIMVMKLGDGQQRTRLRGMERHCYSAYQSKFSKSSSAVQGIYKAMGNAYLCLLFLKIGTTEQQRLCAMRVLRVDNKKTIKSYRFSFVAKPFPEAFQSEMERYLRIELSQLYEELSPLVQQAEAQRRAANDSKVTSGSASGHGSGHDTPSPSSGGEHSPDNSLASGDPTAALIKLAKERDAKASQAVREGNAEKSKRLLDALKTPLSVKEKNRIKTFQAISAEDQVAFKLLPVDYSKALAEAVRQFIMAATSGVDLNARKKFVNKNYTTIFGSVNLGSTQRSKTFADIVTAAEAARRVELPILMLFTGVLTNLERWALTGEKLRQDFWTAISLEVNGLAGNNIAEKSSSLLHALERLSDGNIKRRILQAIEKFLFAAESKDDLEARRQYVIEHCRQFIDPQINEGTFESRQLIPYPLQQDSDAPHQAGRGARRRQMYFPGWVDAIAARKRNDFSPEKAKSTRPAGRGESYPGGTASLSPGLGSGAEFDSMADMFGLMSGALPEVKPPEISSSEVDSHRDVLGALAENLGEEDGAAASPPAESPPVPAGSSLLTQALMRGAAGDSHQAGAAASSGLGFHAGLSAGRTAVAFMQNPAGVDCKITFDYQATPATEDHCFYALQQYGVSRISYVKLLKTYLDPSSSSSSSMRSNHMSQLQTDDVITLLLPELISVYTMDDTTYVRVPEANQQLCLALREALQGRGLTIQNYQHLQQRSRELYCSLEENYTALTGYNFEGVDNVLEMMDSYLSFHPLNSIGDMEVMHATNLRTLHQSFSQYQKVLEGFSRHNMVLSSPALLSTYIQHVEMSGYMIGRESIELLAKVHNWRVAFYARQAGEAGPDMPEQLRPAFNYDGVNPDIDAGQNVALMMDKTPEGGMLIHSLELKKVEELVDDRLDVPGARPIQDPRTRRQ